MYTCKCGFAFSLWNALLIVSWLCSLTSECPLCRSCSFSGNFLPLLGSQVDFNSALWDLACLSLPSHSPGDLDGKESACNTGDIRDLGSITGLGRCSGEGNDRRSILAWRTPWTEEPGGLQSIESQRFEPNWAANTNMHTVFIPPSSLPAPKFPFLQDS